MATEAERLEAEANALRLGLSKAQERLEKASRRLDALTTLVDKQSQHLRQLKVRSGEGEVIFLPDYAEMKLKHHQHRNLIIESRVAVASVELELKTKKKDLAIIDGKLKPLRTALENRGKLLLLRK